MQSLLGKVGLGPKKDIQDLTGRVALVTGGALGIGYEISRAFALANARVIMIGRKEEEGKEAIEKIKAESEGKAQVEWTHCDLGDLKEVKEVFTRIRTTESRLDLLILNAGMNPNQYAVNDLNIERIFGVNWLGNFYVLNLLYPLLRATSKIPGVPAPRIVFDSSEMHRWAPKDTKFDSIKDINDEKLTPSELYGRTKLAMILAAKYGLAQGVIAKNNDKIWALSVHPGTVSTDIQEQWQDAYPGIQGTALTTAMYVVGRDVEQGSYPALYAATSPEIEEKGWNGVYFSDIATLGKETDQASDPALAASLWELSEKLIRDRLDDDALLPWDEVKTEAKTA